MNKHNSSYGFPQLWRWAKNLNGSSKLLKRKMVDSPGFEPLVGRRRRRAVRKIILVREVNRKNLTKFKLLSGGKECNSLHGQSGSEKMESTLSRKSNVIVRC